VWIFRDLRSSAREQPPRRPPLGRHRSPPIPSRHSLLLYSPLVVAGGDCRRPARPPRMAAVGRFSGISPLFGLPVLRSERVLCRAVQVPAAGVAGAGVVPRAVVFLVPGFIGGLCSTVQHLVLQVQPGDGLATSVGGGGAAPFRLWTHVVVGQELGGGRAPRGVGFCGTWAGYALSSWRWRPVAVVSMAVWGSCRRRGAALSSLSPLPSPYDIVYCCGRGISEST
jgi:hypothetical protein